MATIAEQIRYTNKGRRRLLTAADLAEMPSNLPSGTVHFELQDGNLIAHPPITVVRSQAITVIAGALWRQGEKRNFGRGCVGGVGIILRRNPDTVVAADTVFLANRSLPLQTTSEDYFETMPDLIVDALDIDDPPTRYARRVSNYMKAGANLIWIADPNIKIVTEYRRDKAPAMFTEDDVLTVEDIIPGFQLPVRDVFGE